MTAADPRPGFDEYFIGIAMAVRTRARCLGRHVGAVLVRDGRIVGTGYNGTPKGMPNCDEAERGCHRCAHRDEYPHGVGYDLCICVHAEQNAILSAARFGNAVDGAALYSTLQPCFGCLKESLQAGIQRIYWLNPWTPSPDFAEPYRLILAQFEVAQRIEGIADPLGARGGA